MKQLRRHPLFLVAVALALPFGIAFLNYDFYDDNDLVCNTQISMADNADLLGLLKKNLKLFVAADEFLQSAGIHFFETISFRCIRLISTPSTSSVLRC
jgi:hypothetical protein